MNTVLVHPVHGAKVAICEKELLRDLANGWSIYVTNNDESDHADDATHTQINNLPTKRKRKA